MNTEHVFVYGTLRPPQDGTSAAESHFFPRIKSYVQNHQPARLIDAELYSLGSYPAVIRGAGEVQGDLLTVDAAALPTMDRIEGHPTFFARERAVVQTSTGHREAWIYLAPPALTFGKARIASGDWFRRKEQNLASDFVSSDAGLSAPVEPELQQHVKRFAESECSWLATVRPDGRAHCAPMWHAWHRGRIYIVCQPESVKYKNIAENPSVTITHPDAMDVIVIEGWAMETPEMQTILQPIFQRKYDWDITTDSEYTAIIEITPIKLLAWHNTKPKRWHGTEVMRTLD
jgi:gamma-glutamylcyclotransferase (GGCT)/AIG2-like uncharacterized protein YtfP/general stress protein 26